MSLPKLSRVVFSTGKDDWQTPPEFFAKLDAEFHFSLDVAASRANALCERWFGPDHPDNWSRNALVRQWGNGTQAIAAYCNPPYSRGLQKQFIAKAAEQVEEHDGLTVVMLLPARTDTRAFHDYIWDEVRHGPRTRVEVRFVRGRLKFVGASAGAPFPSMVVVFRGYSA